MIALGAAIAAGYGVALVYTAVAFGWRGLGPGPRPGPKDDAARPGAAAGGRFGRLARTGREWLTQAGLGDVAPAEFGTVIAGLFVVGAAGGL